ncbi:MAG: helix-turn-helix domain-containing protein [Flavipsychrobacter sp.]|nr:helix-turn-helix domain-containing protein [Flavipsychrobacter sp.]
MKPTNNFHFASNVKFLRERKGLSQEELSTNLGMTRAKIAAYEIGHTKNPSMVDLNVLSEFFLISVDGLLKIDLSALSEQKFALFEGGKMSGTDLRIIVTTVTSQNEEKIEYVPIKAKAGYLKGYADPDFISQLPVFDLPHLPKDKKYRMFPTEGDSMLPIPEGSLVIGEYVDDWLSLKNGELCIVITKNEGIVFKQVENKMKDERRLLLSSLNPIYHQFEVLVSDILEIWKYNCFISDGVPTIGDHSIHQVYEEIRDVKMDLKRILKKVNA